MEQFEYELTYVNLTPHKITVLCGHTLQPVMTLPPSGAVARVSAIPQRVGNDGKIMFFRTQYGIIEGLPSPVPGTRYITSAQLRLAVHHRNDVVSPGHQVRDSDGNTTGCIGLEVQP